MFEKTLRTWFMVLINMLQYFRVEEYLKRNTKETLHAVLPLLMMNNKFLYDIFLVPFYFLIVSFEF